MTSSANGLLALPVFRMLITAEKPLRLENAIGLRGYFGSAYRENPALRQFMEDSVKYRYPRIQYKVIDGNGMVLGFAEGAPVLRGLPPPESMLIGHDTLLVVGLKTADSEGAWGLAREVHAYRFLTPLLCLDEAGLAKYFRLKKPEHQKFFLEDLLIGSILAISKNIGYRVPDTVVAAFGELSAITEMIHGKHTLIFKGTFTVNFEIPDYFGLGRSVARGYGTVKRIEK